MNLRTMTLVTNIAHHCHRSWSHSAFLHSNGCTVGVAITGARYNRHCFVDTPITDRFFSKQNNADDCFKLFDIFPFWSTAVPDQKGTTCKGHLSHSSLQRQSGAPQPFHDPSTGTPSTNHLEALEDGTQGPPRTLDWVGLHRLDHPSNDQFSPLRPLTVTHNADTTPPSLLSSHHVHVLTCPFRPEAT